MQRWKRVLLWGTLAAAGLLVVGGGAGAWWLARPPSVSWTEQEIMALQHAALEDEMPSGQAAWPLLEEARRRYDAITGAWPGEMAQAPTFVLESLLRMPWDDPRLAGARAAFDDLSPVIEMTIEASHRRRLFIDGPMARMSGAFMDGGATIPAQQTAPLIDALRVEARRRLHNGDERGFVELTARAGELIGVLTQSPLVLSRVMLGARASGLLDDLTHAARERRLSPAYCEALRDIALGLHRDLGEGLDRVWESDLLWSLVRAAQAARDIQEMDPSSRAQLRLSGMMGWTDTLRWEEAESLAWLRVFDASGGAKARRLIEEDNRALAAWWLTPARTRSPVPPPGAYSFSYEAIDISRLQASSRGTYDLLMARAVGVAALLELEAHHARTAEWPDDLSDAPRAAELRDPITGEALVYERAPADAEGAWHFTLRLPIDDATLARLQPSFLPDEEIVSVVDQRLITRPAPTIPEDELSSYPWLLEESP